MIAEVGVRVDPDPAVGADRVDLRGQGVSLGTRGLLARDLGRGREALRGRGPRPEIGR